MKLTHVLMFIMVAVCASPGFAQTSVDARGDVSGSGIPGGSLIPGYDSRTCDGTIEGAIRYNSASNAVEFCNGTIWTATADGCAPNPACPNVGNVCDGDGSGGGNPKFAGCVCYYDTNSADSGKCKLLYATQANQSTSSNWKTSTGANDIATDSTEDGEVNDGQVANSTTFPSFKLCKDLTDGGYTDWYLPARAELDLLWRNRVAIGGFTTGSHWSSSESDTTNSWSHNFTNGSIGANAKNSGRVVRCVRRD